MKRLTALIAGCLLRHIGLWLTQASLAVATGLLVWGYITAPQWLAAVLGG